MEQLAYLCQTVGFFFSESKNISRFSQVMMMGNTPLAHLLLKYGADPNLPDPGTGSTPLHDAARAGFIDTVRLLILFNADPNATDHCNLRPVDVARQADHVDVVEFLSRF